MHNRLNNKYTESEYVSQMLSLIARRDKVGLHALLEAELRTIDFVYHNETVAETLAQAGDDTSVNWLIEHFHPSLEKLTVIYSSRLNDDRFIEADVGMKYFLTGYARAGKIRLVNDMLRVEDSISIRNAVVKAYASVGNHDQVQRWLAEGADKNYAALGYANANLHEQVNFLLVDGADINTVVYAYAKYGNREKADELISMGADEGYAHLGAHAANRKELAALYNGFYWDTSSIYAYTGQVSEVNLSCVGKTASTPDANGFSSNGCFQHADRFLQVMTWLTNDSLREVLAEEYLKETSSALEDVEALVAKSAQFRELKRRYDISYYEASQLDNDVVNWLLTNGEAVTIWLLQGPSVMCDTYQLPAELYIKITSEVLDVPMQTAIDCQKKVSERLYSNTKNKIDHTYKHSLFARLFGSCLEYDRGHRKALKQLDAVTCDRLRYHD